MTTPIDSLAALGWQGQLAIDNAAPCSFRFNFISDKMAMSEQIADFTGVEGTRQHSIERTRPGNQKVGGPILLEPTANELAVLLPFILGGTVTQAAGSKVAAPASPSASASASGGALIAGQEYFYKITAVGASGESTPGTEVHATPSGSDLKVTLAWTAAAGATSYKVYRGTTSGAENVLVATVTPGSASGYVDLGALIATPVPAAALASGGTLASGTEVYYVVSATNGNGETVQSSEVSETPTSSTLAVLLTWVQIPGATGYRIYRSTSSGTYGSTSFLTAIGSGSTVAYTDTGASTTAGQPVSTGTAFAAQPGTPPGGNTAITGSSTYTLGEVLPTCAVQSDRVSGVFTYPVCGVDVATFTAAKGGGPLQLSLNLVGISESVSEAGTFPALTLDTVTRPFLLFDLTLTINGVVYSADSFTLTINNFIDKTRYFNSQVLTAIVATDQSITFSTQLPEATAAALYGAGAAGVSMTASFAYGNQILTFTAVSLQFPRQSPVITGRSQEIMLPITGTLKKMGGTSALVVTLQPGP